MKYVAIALAALAVGTMPAEAARAPGPTVDVQSAAALAADGGSLTVQVLASCPERWTVLDARVVVTQGSASGQASFPLTCTGQLRMFSVAVPAAAGAFALGEADAAAAVTIERGRTQRAQDSEVVDVQPAVSVALADTARLESGGAAVTIAVTVACPVGATGAQSYVNVTQGQATGNGFYVPVCDGRPHTFAVRVQAAVGAFVAGAARALTFATVEHAGIAFSGVDDRPVTLVA